MKDSRGITLASLVVMIVSIILLATMAISFGYRYLTETKETDEKYFKDVLSTAVSKRENNHTVSSNEFPRVGYPIKSAEDFSEIIDNYIPELKGANNELLYERGNWYIVDQKNAEDLGVKASDKYIDVLDENNDEKMTVTVVDYASGTVYIIDIDDFDNLKNNISGDVTNPNDNHEHDYNLPEATCTEDRKCLVCGYIVEPALGHNYEGEMEAEPVDDEFHYKKECTRCHMKGGYERHKDLDEYAFFESGDGSWWHYNGCSVCGWPRDNRNYEPCSIVYKSISDTEHIKQCKTCKNEETYEHDFKWEFVDEVYHEEVCTICGFLRTKFEAHEGERYCDKCGCEIIKTQNPVLTKVLVKNKDYPESKYVTNGETIQVIFTADKSITDAKVTICGYGGDNIRYYYSDDKYTCTAELYVDSNVTIPPNTDVTFSIDCKSVTTGAPLEKTMTDTTDDDSYLIFDNVPPTIEYIPKDNY